jgi:uncharacterized protein YdhG (YjbR/CyaY superfamily)
VAKYESVDAYMATLPDEKRAVMERIRAIAVAGAPNATEAISYNMPALRQDGRFLLSYEAYKKHYSLFPASDAVLAEIGEEARRHFSGRGTFQFKAGEALPEDLIRRIVALLVREFERPRT